MARLKKIKTNFTGGQVDVGMYGRADIRAFNNGAARLENVFVRPLGGARRRDGLVHVDALAGASRIIGFEFNTEQTYLLAFSDSLITVYRGDAQVATIVTPWPSGELLNLAWTQSADTLLVVHPDYPMKRITRTSDTAWTISNWTFDAEDDDQSKRIYQPHGSFPVDDIKLNPAATSGNGVAVSADGDVFTSQHVGVRLRIKDKEVEVASFVDARNITVDIIESLPNSSATLDWTEAALSPARGYAATATFHQDRLVIGGSRDLPNRLWISQTQAFFNFDLADALNDEAMDVGVLSDQVNAIRGVFSGRDLQIFTSGAEFRVVGDPLTPSDISIKRQTRLGSRVERHIPPSSVDGATIFIPRLDPRPREFLYSDVEQAYSVNDLATVSNDLLNSPRRMAYDQDDRLLHVVNGDGTLATLTIYRNEEVAAWTLGRTTGSFTDVESISGVTYVVVRRGDDYTLERFAPDVNTDSAVIGDVETPTTAWSGLSHLEGMTVAIVADGYEHRRLMVLDGAVELDFPASSVEIGLPFTHYIWPLPVTMLSDQDANVGLRIRPVAFRCRVARTKAITIDLGEGLREQPFRTFGDPVFGQPLEEFSGDKLFRQRGWRSSDFDPLWKIEQDSPFNFELILAISEISLND